MTDENEFYQLRIYEDWYDRKFYFKHETTLNRVVEVLKLLDIDHEVNKLYYHAGLVDGEQ